MDNHNDPLRRVQEFIAQQILAEGGNLSFVDSPDHCACGKYAPNAKHRSLAGHAICDECAEFA